MLFLSWMNESYTQINAAELKEQLATPCPPVLVDVRLDEDYQFSHLPGATSNCVFEVVFSDRISSVAPNPAARICVYGADSGSLESRMAAEKLSRLGYAEVYDFRDGIQGWRDAGFEIESFAERHRAISTVADGIHPIDVQESRVLWIGRNLLNRHEGTIALKSGTVEIRAGRLAGGAFAIDMQAITCLDLADNPLHDVLIRHLLDHDFFDAARYPEASFVITRATGIPDATPGTPDLAISGILTMKGVAAPLEFNACPGVTAEG